MMYTQGLQCSSFLGSILESLSRKQVITKKELHSSPWVACKETTWASELPVLVKRLGHLGLPIGLAASAGALERLPSSAIRDMANVVNITGQPRV